MAIEHASRENFAERTAQGLVLVDFWAAWCGPCRMLGPVLEDLDLEWGDKLSIVKVNVDDDGQLAFQYEVMSIPTMVLLKDGQVVERIVGYQSKKSLADLIQPHL